MKFLPEAGTIPAWITAGITASLLASLSVVRAGSTSSPANERPNIILIFSDDLGMDSVHCTGAPFKTPHIDRLAREGTVFAQCYSTPLCGPSRCEVLTGRYPFRTGLVSNQSSEAIQPSKEVMIPSVLKKAGYATACAGKWGQLPLGPLEWGFDESIIFTNAKDGGRYWLDEKAGLYLLNGKEASAPGKYFPDLVHDFVTDFVSRHKDQPFFVYYSMPHVHNPILPTPDSVKGADRNQLYRDNVEYMDKLVGRLAGELDRMDLRRKTLLIFTGDNGTAPLGVEAGATVNGRQVNGQKGTMLEGGSRVPLIANWPGTTPAGRTLNDLVDFSDFFGTFAELAGAPLPEGVVLDSHSFAPQLLGQTGTPRDWVYVELNGQSYVRDNKFKLTNTGELFDLSEAPFVEKPIPRDTKDAEAAAARAKLQKILDDHPAGSAVKEIKKKGGKTKQQEA